MSKKSQKNLIQTQPQGNQEAKELELEVELQNQQDQVFIQPYSDQTAEQIAVQPDQLAEPPQNEDEPPAVPKKRGGWASILFLLIICGLSVFIMIQLALTFNDGEILPFAQLLSRTNWGYFALAIGVLAVLMITDFLKYIILLKAATGKFQIATGIKVSLLGRYYDNVTPFSAGEGMQVYYLYKKGLSTGKASSVVFSRFIMQMFIWLVFTLAFLIWQRGALDQLPGETATFLRASSWVGWALMAVVPTLLICFSLSPKIFNSIVTFFVVVGNKLRLVKNADAAKIKVLKTVKDYRKGFGLVAKKPVTVVLITVLCLIEPFLTMGFPYFLLMAFAKDSLATTGFPLIIQVIALNVFATYSVTYTPTPGNTGFVEAAFTIAFQAIASSILFWVVFSWRFMTYYIYIIIGLGISIFELIRKAVRARRAKRREQEQFL